MSKIKEYITEEERSKLIEELIDAYAYYISDSDDKELQEIYESGCFTVGSMNYYKAKALAEKGEINEKI